MQFLLNQYVYQKRAFQQDDQNRVVHPAQCSVVKYSMKILKLAQTFYVICLEQTGYMRFLLQSSVINNHQFPIRNTFLFSVFLQEISDVIYNNDNKFYSMVCQTITGYGHYCFSSVQLSCCFPTHRTPKASKTSLQF